MFRGLAVLFCVAMAGCAAAPPPAPARPAEASQQYELRAAGPGATWEACRRPGEAAECRQALVLARRAGPQLQSADPPACCWECASGRNACGREQWPGRAVAIDAHPLPVRGRCDASGAADFEGDGQAALRLYLDWLVRSYGAPYLDDPADVALAIPPSGPRPTENGMTAGEVSCSDGDDGPAFQISLFRATLEGRPLQSLYGALAHEFRHVIQIRRDGLACRPTASTKAALEQDAEDWSRRLVPPCQ